MDKVCLIGGLRSYIGLTGDVYKHVPANVEQNVQYDADR